MLRNILCIGVILTTLVALPAHATQKILILGDSLSAAYGLEKSLGWVNLLDDKLKQLDYTYEVINASISGETTAGGANKINQTLKFHQPDIIVVELGGNDGLQGLKIAAMKKNLTDILIATHQSKTKTLLIGMKIPPNYGLKYTQQFSDTFKQLANEYQTGYVPFLLEGIGGNPLLMQRDGVHANEKAQPKILDNVWPALLPLLEK